MMRSSFLTLVFAVAAPVALGSMACFLSTEGEGYDYDSYGDGGTSGDCDVGHEGCSCTSGGSCNPGLRCDNNQNICFLDTCPVGNEGCDCTPGGACNPGLLCLSEVCVAQCSPGTESCPCTDGGGCDPGLQCLSDTCVDTTGVDGDDGEDDSSADSESDGAADSESDGGCGNCTAPPACPADGEMCQCACEEVCDGDDVVLCPNGADGCQEVQNCVNGCVELDDGPECIPSADSTGGGMGSGTTGG